MLFTSQYKSEMNKKKAELTSTNTFVLEYVDFWFDSIHCHAGETTYIRKDFSLDPPIIVVFTCKDKYKEVTIL